MSNYKNYVPILYQTSDINPEEYKMNNTFCFRVHQKNKSENCILNHLSKSPPPHQNSWENEKGKKKAAKL